MKPVFTTAFPSPRAALLLAALSCCTTASAVDATYQYFRFTPLKLRNDATANSIQIAEFAFLKSGAPLSLTGVTADNPGGNRPVNEAASDMLDGNTATKWLDFYRNPVIFGFTEPVTIDGYRFTTANDAAERDPVRWILEGSNDQTTWVVLDHPEADFATPAARLTSTGDILLGTATSAEAKLWAGGDPVNWDTSTANWDKAGPVVWDNASTDIARFPAGTPATVNLAAPVSARAIDFVAPVTLVQGGNTLTFTNITRVNPGADLEISSAIAGTVGVIKTGPQKLTLSGANTFTGPLQVRAGSAVVSGTNTFNGLTSVSGGATLTFTGAATKAATGSVEVGNAAGNGTLLLDPGGTLAFNGTPVAGTGTGTPGAGAIRQTSGTVTFSQDGQYFTLGNTAGSYGVFELSGGTASTPNNSGIRVGFNGTGVLTQSGGSLSCGRWFAIGNANGKGLLTLTGGTAAISNSAYRLICGDATGGEGVVNIGTAAGGTGTFSAIRNDAAANNGSIVLGAAASSTGIINLNSGVLKIHSRIYRQSTVTSTGIVNFNGGTLTAGANNIELANNSLTAVRMYQGGVTIDTDGNAATFAAPITGMTGNGLAIVSLPVTSGGTGYIGAPLVSISTTGSGGGAMAVATVSDGAVTGVTLTCPGDGYAAGDTVFFDFASGGADTPAESLEYVLTASDVAPNNTGGLTKTGAGALTLSQASTFTGPLQVNAGSLVANGTLAQTAATVAAGATLTGNLNTAGSVTVNGTLAPGAAVGSAIGTSSLTLAEGSTFAAQIGDWNGAAGTGYDTADFASLAITATSGSKLTVQVDTTGIANFSESARDFTIVTTDALPTGLSADNWQVTTTGFTGTGTWSLAVEGNNLVLSYDPAAGGYATWIGAFPGLSDSTAGGDPEKDGITNLVEYVLNGDPGASSTAILPQTVSSGGNLVFSFVRRAESKSDTTQTVQYGTTLGGWTDIAIPATSAGNVVITPNTPSAGLETVVVTIPAAPNPNFFARLKVVQP